MCKKVIIVNYVAFDCSYSSHKSYHMVLNSPDLPKCEILTDPDK
jgi:hypothetical protein